MRNIKKAIMLLLSILIIVAVANTALASTIQPRNITENETTNNSSNENEDKNETENETENEAENTTENNVTSNNLITSNNTLGNVSQINTTNSAENIPHTGNENTYINFAFLLLLAVVLGIFSFVQYNKVSTKEK